MHPILFHLGPFPVFAFGALVALGVLLTLFLISRRASKLGWISSQTATDLVYVAVLSGFAGGRIFYIAQNFSFYAQNPLKVFALWEGGLIFYGGVAGSLVGLWFMCRAKKIPYLGALDLLIPYVALVHAFGRLGCFLNGCCYGKSCDLPWAVQFIESPGPVHPVQIYESLSLFLLFAFLNTVYLKKKFDGQILGFYFAIYGIIRFAMEFFRENPALGILTYNQWISVLIAIAGALLLMRKPRPHAA